MACSRARQGTLVSPKATGNCTCNHTRGLCCKMQGLCLAANAHHQAIQEEWGGGVDCEMHCRWHAQKRQAAHCVVCAVEGLQSIAAQTGSSTPQAHTAVCAMQLQHVHAALQQQPLACHPSQAGKGTGAVCCMRIHNTMALCVLLPACAHTAMLMCRPACTSWLAGSLA